MTLVWHDSRCPCYLSLCPYILIINNKPDSLKVKSVKRRRTPNIQREKLLYISSFHMHWIQYTILLYMQESRIHFSYNINISLFSQTRFKSFSPQTTTFFFIISSCQKFWEDDQVSYVALSLCCYYRRSSWISNKWREVATFSKEPTLSQNPSLLYAYLRRYHCCKCHYFTPQFLLCMNMNSAVLVISWTSVGLCVVVPWIQNIKRKKAQHK